MSVLGRLAATGVLVAAAVLGWSPSVHAQGVTTAAVRGTITREGGTPVDGAVITVINVPKGTRLRTTSAASGRYSFENVESGGPYTIEVTAIGFEKSTKTGVILTLGQRSIQDFELKAQVVVLQELEITATTDPLINSAKTGPQTTVSDSAIQRVPILGRNWGGLLQSSPQVVGNSIAGQNNRFNTVQIDGAVNNDVFGLPSNQQPGGQASVKPLSIEAFKEFQVLVAPYDIRQGGFTGGLVNAVTKSGTNKFSGSLFAYFQNEDLVGKDTAGLKVTEFQQPQYGGTLGGPIIKDKLHFFVAADIQKRDAPYFGPEVSEPSTGITAATADRVTAALRSKYGFDPGTYDAPVTQTPNDNVFAKLTGTLGASHQVEVSYNYVNGFSDIFSRTSRSRNDRDGFQLSNSGYAQDNETNSFKGKWLGQFGGVSTEVIAGYMTIRDKRAVANDVPLFLVQGDVTGNWIAGGGEKFSQNNYLDQNIAELTANATWTMGRHAITVGTHNERYSFVNGFFAGSKGVWSFNNVDRLEAGVADRYEVNLPGAKGPDGWLADWSAYQIGGYVQDQWSPGDNFTLTAGLRVDVPYADAPTTNATLKADPALGIDTGDFPSGNLLFSPRLGFNWDIANDGVTLVRGGIGMFSGRVPFVWMSNAFTGTGGEQLTLICTGAAVPAVTADVDNLPTACASGGPPTPPLANIVSFDSEFKFQQALKYSVGVDRRLPGGVVASLDFLHTRNYNTMYLNDVNLTEGAANSEGRVMYGTIAAGSSSTTQNRKSSGFRQVLVHTNKDQGYSTLITAQLNKRFANNLEFAAAYTYSQTKDVYSLTSSIASSNFNFTALDGTLANRSLRTSGFDTPHKVLLSGSANLPLDFMASLLYTGTAGTPYAYVVTQDANADGVSGNDLIYVPAGPSEISLTNAADWERFNIWMAGEECVFAQRGKVMERNSCRNPWTHFVDFRLGKRINTFGSQAMEITADIFNLLNLINSDWGLNRSTSGFEAATGVLNVAGWDAANNRPRYSVANPISVARERVSVSSSRWRMQLGLKYAW
jgi:outer membrane receptor protein involved in Fe transport